MKHKRIDEAKANSEPMASFPPIACALLKVDASTKERMTRKFDICYVMAKEGIAFAKYPALYDLECRHDVELGIAYKNDVSAKSFTHFIAETQRRNFIDCLSKLHFFSVLMDGTTDAGRVEDELVVTVHCKKDDVAREIKSCARYLAVVTPIKCDADGL